MTKRPLTMSPQSRRLTRAQTSPGAAAPSENARTAACRLDISSAAGSPLPATSAIEQPEHVLVERERVVAVATIATCRAPRGGHPRGPMHGSVDGSSPRWMARASDCSRSCRTFCWRATRPPRSRGENLQQRRVVPRFLDEAARPAAHRLDRRIDRPPAGHDDHGQERVEHAARDTSSSPSPADVVSRV